MPASSVSRSSGVRERFRRQVQHELKEIALDQIAQGGIGALSLNAIAKRLGMSGPALYRYISGRDELLDTLVIDAYTDLAAALNREIDRARASTPAPDERTLVGVWARAYRGWALAQPHRYGLLYGPTVPGYDAQTTPVVAAAHTAITPLLIIWGRLQPDDEDAGAPTSETLAGQIRRWSEKAGHPVGAAAAARTITTWWRVHGFITLEIGSSWQSMGFDADALYTEEIDACSR